MSSLTSLGIEHQSFHVASCGTCKQRGLAWLDVDDEGSELWRCLSCGSELIADTPSAPPLQEVGARSVKALGYVFVDEVWSASSNKRSACGASGVRACPPSGGCSSGGCGSGGCGSGGCG